MGRPEDIKTNTLVRKRINGPEFWNLVETFVGKRVGGGSRQLQKKEKCIKSVVTDFRPLFVPKGIGFDENIMFNTVLFQGTKNSCLYTKFKCQPSVFGSFMVNLLVLLEYAENDVSTKRLENRRNISFNKGNKFFSNFQKGHVYKLVNVTMGGKVRVKRDDFIFSFFLSKTGEERLPLQ